MKLFLIALATFFVGLGVGATSNTPEPTPEPTPRIVEVPGPTQTIEIEVPGPTITETVEIERTPAECLEAVVALWEFASNAVSILADIEADYYDYPDENVQEFGIRVEDRVLSWQTNDPLGEIPSTHTAC